MHRNYIVPHSLYSVNAREPVSSVKRSVYKIIIATLSPKLSIKYRLDAEF